MLGMLQMLRTRSAPVPLTTDASMPEALGRPHDHVYIRIRCVRQGVTLIAELDGMCNRKVPSARGRGCWDVPSLEIVSRHSIHNIGDS